MWFKASAPGSLMLLGEYAILEGGQALVAAINHRMIVILKVIDAWLKLDKSAEDIILEARTIVREVQGIGSGADVAACVLGGVVAYSSELFYAEKIFYNYPITVIYSGSKTKTVDAIHYVKNYFSSKPSLFQKIMEEINECALLGISAVKENNHEKLGTVMQEQQKLMHQLQVNTPELQKIVSDLQADPRILGAKISGSGLGDCVIGLGEGQTKKKIPCQIDSQGVFVETFS